MVKKSIFKLVLSILLCQAAGLIGALFTAPAITSWYVSLSKPPFNPPNWLFGPVWLILYLLMGIAFYLVWLKGLNDQKVWSATKLFLVHLGVNASWSVVFFGLKQLFWGWLVILILWCLIIALMIKFWRIEPRSSWLLLPYFLWVSFAALLNYYYWQLN